MKFRFFAFAALIYAALSFTPSYAQVGVSVQIAPPTLVVEQQPVCPVDGYIWTPGYWGYSDVGYYWVPGFWAEPPQVGLLWTPPWWGFNNGVYVFNDGYWGPQVGFYGGINYGFGYFGDGYLGGRWDGNVFSYNAAVTHVNTAVVHNVFEDRSVLSNQANNSNRASFNGPNGVQAQPTAEQKAAESAQHIPATSQQTARREAASKNRDLQASVNKGHPKPEAIRSFDKSTQPAGRAEAAQAAQQGAKKPGQAAAGKAEAAPKTNGAARETQRGEAESRGSARGAEAREARQNGQHRENTHNAEKTSAERGENSRNEENRRPEARENTRQTRGAEARETRAGQTSNAAERRETTDHSRQPQNAAGRQQAEHNGAAEGRSQGQPRTKEAKPKPSPGDQH
ncbi:MAG: YXWGXW repeat-containing protein [Verrucomicrobia bacterium]|nr:YXWGXW repeat-containing protein [Verrucomicrobiota bacterium]